MRKRLAELITHLKTEHTQPGRLGLAVGLGIFIGVLPLYGLHLVLCVIAAVIFGLNKATMVLASQISIPPLAPLIVAAGIAIGDGLRYGELRVVPLAEAASFLDGFALVAGDLPDRFLSCLIGDAVLGIALGTLAGVGTWRWAESRGREASVDRTDRAE